MSLRPAPRLLRLGLALLTLAVAVAFVPALRLPFQALAGLLGLLALGDALAPAWRRAPELTRRLVGRWPVGHEQEVVLRVTTGPARPSRIDLIDGAPQVGPTRGLPLTLELPPQGWTEVSYHLRPDVRGEASFGPAEVLLHSPLGLWAKRASIGEPESVQVVPDHGPALRRALETLAYRVSPTGTRRRPRRGQGTSFHQLREYREGDLPQQIDWKATAKRRQLISREYEEERDQRVLIALDRGRRMRAHDDQRTLFDRALDASLVLAYIALRQGDSVGLLGFSGPVDALPSVKGPRALPTLFRHVQGWLPGEAPSDYSEAARNVLTREPRRTLLVILTNLRCEDTAELVRAVHSLQRRHLVVVASLREAVLDEQLSAPVRELDDAVTSAAAAHLFEGRRQALEAVRQAGAMALDCTTTELPTRLAETYLDAKTGGRL